MIDIDTYISQLIAALRAQYGSKLLYVGLQGSYLRGEATEDSDLDVMVVLEQLTVSDLACYRTIIQSMEHFEKSCGFICSKTDLANWNPLEICSLLHGTKDCYGDLRELVPVYSETDVRNFAKLSVNNLYHEICHRYIHAQNNKSMERLTASYKGVFFILQTLYYLKTGTFLSTKAELLPLLDGIDHAVLTRAKELGKGVEHDFSESFALLFTWCQQTLHDL